MLALVFAAAIFCSAVHSQSTGNRRCPNDWVSFGSYCYAFLQDITPWSTAVEMCRQLSSSLLTITNERENSFIAAQLRARHGTGGKNWYWLNINDFVREGNWVQRDNQPLVYTRWYANQPDNGDVYNSGNVYNRTENGENCAVITADGTWHDLFCEDYTRGTYKPRPVCKKSFSVLVLQ